MTIFKFQMNKLGAWKLKFGTWIFKNNVCE